MNIFDPTKTYTVSKAVRLTAATLCSVGLQTSGLDARVLVGHVCHMSREDMILRDSQVLSAGEVIQLQALCERRMQSEPVAYLTGKKEFFGQTFSVSSDVLIPRPDTEVLVEEAIRFCQEAPSPVKVLDLGTGSGAIVLSILSEVPEATGLGIDISPAALTIAERNAKDLGLSKKVLFERGDWAKEVNGSFDLVVSNPPYISSPEMKGLMKGVVNFEPEGALHGGEDGLAPLRLIARDLPRLLSDQGLFLGEIGAGQDDLAKVILHNAGLKPNKSVPDLSGIPRCVAARPYAAKESVENSAF
jgi:release factor glutamine methyltransferase